MVAAAGMGFLLAVLWFDLMFDVQAWRHSSDVDSIPDRVVDSIGTYYRRVTTDARPMNRLVAAAMVVTLAALVTVTVRDGGWARVTALVLTALPIALAGTMIVPAAVRLGAEVDEMSVRRRLVRTILLGHVACWVSIAAALVVLLVRA